MLGHACLDVIHTQQSASSHETVNDSGWATVAVVRPIHCRL